ncbi:hypothetical protein PF002_g19837 [Phytophthora fragariae]|nr:hypothetical protein PF002_g19837 [Phytophthora fragariae]
MALAKYFTLLLSVLPAPAGPAGAAPSFVTTDVHARDIVESLWTEKVDSVGNFIWQQQLRYYWDAQADDVLIRHSDSVIHYGYEYGSYVAAGDHSFDRLLLDDCTEWARIMGFLVAPPKSRKKQQFRLPTKTKSNR